MKKIVSLLAICIILSVSYGAISLYPGGRNNPARAADEVMPLPSAVGQGTISTAAYSSAAVTFVTTSVGTTTYGSGAILITASPILTTPRFVMNCAEDSCTARGVSMEQAREMLERIASRGIQIDITVDQNCHPQRESIPARRPEIASND